MNPTHRHIPTGSYVFPGGYDPAELELLPDSFWQEFEALRAIGDARALRNQRLAETDKYLASDWPLDAEVREAIIEYRRALRDMTFGDEIVWPTVPTLP